MTWIYDDGGRAEAGFKGSAGDCSTRAIAIATGRSYADIYSTLTALSKATGGKTAREGVSRKVIRKFLAEIGWTWTPTMHIGSGTTVHLRADELPAGRIIVSLSRHISAVIDGIPHDTYDASRDGSRCVYGFWSQ